MRKMVKYAQNMRKVVKYARAYLYAQSGQICAHMRAHISTMPVNIVVSLKNHHPYVNSLHLKDKETVAVSV